MIEADQELTTELPTEFYRPPWADPTFILAINYLSVTQVSLAAGTVALVAKNNPKRWALGFAAVFSGAPTIQLAPWNDPNVYQFTQVTSVASVWYYLIQHGPLVTGEWYGSSSGPTSLRLLEVLIN